MDSALVNIFGEEDLLKEQERGIETIYGKWFADIRHNVEGMSEIGSDVDANIFNLIRDWVDTEKMLN